MTKDEIRFRAWMVDFYKNIHSHPKSFYFTEEGIESSNFWTGRPSMANRVYKALFK